MKADLPQPARIVARVVENHCTITLSLDTPLACSPGQFAMVWLPGLDEKPFSISADDPLAFTVSRVGPFSEALHELGPGDTLWFRGPFGRGFDVESGCREPILVGGGYGAAPLAFLAQCLLARPNRTRPVRIHAVLGARTAADVLFADRFTALACEVHPVTEDGTAGRRGLATDEAREILAQGRADRLFACGPEGMLDALASLARATRVPAGLSREAYLRCGVGACGSCVHGDRLVWLDGPVFEVRP